MLILYGKDASEWCQYLQSLFHSCQDLQTCLVESGAPIPPEQVAVFQSSRCVVLLLSCELVQTFQSPAVLRSLQEVLQPPHKVVKLFCGVAEWEDYHACFKDWSQWKHLTYDDDPETYVAAVMKAIAGGGKLAMPVWGRHRGPPRLFRPGAPSRLCECICQMRHPKG